MLLIFRCAQAKVISKLTDCFDFGIKVKIKSIFFSKILLSTIPESFIKLNMKNRRSRQQQSYINSIQKDGYSARILTLNEDRMIHLHDPLERLKNGTKRELERKDLKISERVILCCPCLQGPEAFHVFSLTGIWPHNMTLSDRKPLDMDDNLTGV